jgi:lysophospholipase L1-like esterase
MLALMGGALAIIPWLSGPALRVERVDPSWFTHESGFAYVLDLAQVGLTAPSDKGGNSSLVVLEDGRPLALPHQSHAAIRSRGSGRYSHWGQAVYLSTSDGSDPHENGRVYSLVQPRSLLAAALGWGRVASVLGFGSILLGVMLGLLSLSPLVSLPADGRRGWLRAHTAPQAGLVGILGLVGWLLYRNQIDVSATSGRLAYAGLLVILLAALVVVLALAFVTFRLRRALDACPWPARRGPGLTHFALFLGAALLAVECVARTVPVFDSFAINPGARFFWPEFFGEPNSLGYNDREPGPKNGPRVLVLGDSYTEGAGVRRHQRYPNLLEGLLRQRDPSVEVFAGARCGFDTGDEADLLERTGDAVQPDVVVVGYVPNDAERPYASRAMVATALDELLGQRFPCYAHYRLHARNRMGNYSRYLTIWREQHDPRGPGWARVTQSLDRIAAWCDARQVRKVLVVFPVFVEGGEGCAEILEQVVQAGRARGFEAYHVGDETFGRLSQLALSPADIHPGPAGHQLIAAGLARRLGPCTMSYQPAPRAAAGP